MSKTTHPKSISRLIELINNEIATQGKLSPKKAKELVLEAAVQQEDLEPFADFEHPIADCYGRQLIHLSDKFEIMAMSWNPGDYSSIHNHGYTEWGVVQVFGNTHHLIYKEKNNTLSFAKKELLPQNAAIKVNNALIHQMGNATTQPYQTLHVYGINEAGCEITADARNYDLEFDRVAHTCGGAFFNLPDDQIHDIVPGIKTTRPVFLHYAYLLMDYYNRQIQTDKIVDLKLNLWKKMESHVFRSQKTLI